MNKKFHSIQKKLVWTFSSVMICALLVTNMFIYVYLYQIYSKELIGNYQDIGKNLSTQLEEDLTSVENFARIVCFDTNLQRLMETHRSQTGYAYYRSIREITTSLSQFVTLRDDLIDDIYIVDSENTIISRNGFYSDTLESDWYQSFLKKNVNFAFSKVHEVERRDSNFPSSRKKVISCIVSMFDLGMPTQPSGFMGYVIINIKLDALMKPSQSFEGFDCLLVDENGEAVESDGNVLAENLSWRDAENDVILDNNRYYFRYSIPLPGWVLIASVEASAIHSQLMQVIMLLICIMLIIMLVSGHIVITLAKNITDPLETLNTGVHQLMRGDFDTRIQIDSGDEIEQISDVFNEMVDNIKNQMEENKKKEAEKRKSQMRFLMAQIKPHFIYNSLNCIIYLARRHQDDDIIQFTRAFISLLQMSIRMKPQQKIPLPSEIENLQNYVTLIHYRYENKTEFLYRMEEDCYEIQLPGLILLPIFENSIFHGILPSKKDGHILLSVSRQEQGVKIMVEDDGCGISGEKLNQIRGMLDREVNGEASEAHIGLLNVNERLKLCYGPQSVLHVESKEGEGTRVWFVCDC